MRTIKNVLKKIILSKALYRHFPFGIDYIIDLKRFYDDKANLTVVDVGGNIGQSVESYVNNFKDPVIYSFEPVNETFKLLKKNVGGLKGVNCYNMAMGSENKIQTIYIQSDSGLNSLNDQFNQLNKSAVTQQITVEKLDNFCEANKVNRIHLLKIDTEGYEMEVLKGAGELIKQKKIDFILAEVGFKDGPDKTNFSLMIDHLHKNGFYFAGLYENSRWGKGSMFVKFANALFVRYELNS
jgi:FkbM family methyltransferase